MGLKTINKLNEGPMDFMRGAGAESGRKVAQSGVGRAVGDVVAAGKQASAIGNFQKLIAQFAQTLATIDKLRPAGQEAPGQQQQEPERQEPTMDAPQQQQRAGQRVPMQEPGVAQAFRTDRKPKGQMGRHGFEYTFNSFLQDTHGEQINEGAWDFVKGAGAAVAGKMRDKINAYADKPSVIKDIYQAGKAASQAGNARAAQGKFDQVVQQGKQLRAQLRQMMAQFGPQAPAIVAKAIAQFPPAVQANIKRHLKVQ